MLQGNLSVGPYPWSWAGCGGHWHRNSLGIEHMRPWCLIPATNRYTFLNSGIPGSSPEHVGAETECAWGLILCWSWTQWAPNGGMPKSDPEWLKEWAGIWVRRHWELSCCKSESAPQTCHCPTTLPLEAQTPQVSMQEFMKQAPKVSHLGPCLQSPRNRKTASHTN